MKSGDMAMIYVGEAPNKAQRAMFPKDGAGILCVLKVKEVTENTIYFDEPIPPCVIPGCKIGRFDND